ncbi:MAG: type IV pilus modification protein PilV [Methylococcaceae bacterium]|nr:MAG: type IV pilus modification protein PilV [Methylococcaceae bacterium]
MSVNITPLRAPAFGFTLIEVLVAVLILAIGLLGLAELQVVGLRNNHNAYLRSQAILLAYDIAERMRANPVGLSSGAYLGTATSDDCEASTCTPQQMAGYDLRQWLDAVATAQLPSSSANITAGGAIYSIVISWSELEYGVLTTKTFTTSFQP